MNDEESTELEVLEMKDRVSNNRSIRIGTSPKYVVLVAMAAKSLVKVLRPDEFRTKSESCSYNWK